MQTKPVPLTVEGVMARVEALAGVARDRAAEFEDLDDLPADVFAAIAASGATRLCVPAAMGGVDGTPLDWFRAVEIIARGDAAVAWIVAQGAVQNAWVSMFTEAVFAREALANPHALPATSINGDATLQPLADGQFELAGRWRFLSGCSGATLLGGLARVLSDSAAPELRFAVVPVAQARISRTWSSMGLRGTGSHEATVGPVRIDPGQTWIIRGSPRLAHPLSCIGQGTWPIAVSVAAVQLGVAAGAIDEAAAVCRGKPQAAFYTGSTAALTESGAVLRQLARASGMLDCARAGVLAALSAVWDAAQEGTVPPDLQARCQLSSATAAWVSADVITTAFRVAGTSGQSRNHPLQRAFRDGHTLTAHVSVNDAAFEGLGRRLFGDPHAVGTPTQKP